MKEQLYTIPLNDAFAADDECPFCYIEQKVEQDLLDFTLGSGSSYMESDIRDMTDKAGFCRYHFQKMFQYGNTLGNAWILKTHFRKINQELDQEIKHLAMYIVIKGPGSFPWHIWRWFRLIHCNTHRGMMPRMPVCLR